jgi:hypothetical protein
MAIIGVPTKIWELPAPVDIPSEVEEIEIPDEIPEEEILSPEMEPVRV